MVQPWALLRNRFAVEGADATLGWKSRILSPRRSYEPCCAGTLERGAGRRRPCHEQPSGIPLGCGCIPSADGGARRASTPGYRLSSFRDEGEAGRAAPVSRSVWECSEPAPALGCACQSESASKLDALHALREVGRRRPTPRRRQAADLPREAEAEGTGARVYGPLKGTRVLGRRFWRGIDVCKREDEGGASERLAMRAIKSVGQFRAHLCLEGACENSPAFQRRVSGSKACIRPEGTVEGKVCFQSSLRDENSFSRLPGVSTPGYCRMSLRDRASNMHARHF
jgi:hypothetical protein